MISGIGFKHEKFKFPCGELHVKLNSTLNNKTEILWYYENNEEIIELLLLVDALRNEGVTIQKLKVPYIPYGRQDRQCEYGEPFSLRVFAKIINSLEIPEVWAYDTHSDVTGALINNLVHIHQDTIWCRYFDEKSNFFLISPDGGALKKIWGLASRVNCEQVICCTKQRDTKTGEIFGVTIPYGDLCGRDCYIVDDICDGGRTFIEIAKVLKAHNSGKIILMVTHGFFTKGLEVFDDLIDEIYTFKKGKVK